MCISHSSFFWEGSLRNSTFDFYEVIMFYMVDLNKQQFVQNSDIEGSKVFGQNIFVCLETSSFSGQNHEFSATIHS